MIDFTSALYLGLRHGSPSLPGWRVLTTGRPAALEDPPGARRVADDLARLQGCEAGTLLPSTLHLFLDLFRIVERPRVAILRDEGSYAVARWGAEAAAARGVRVATFAHHAPGALSRLVATVAGTRMTPIVVTDGFCPACGRVAPVGAYADIARRAGGLLVLDDTQALGVLGETPRPGQPYGRGGGGALRWHQTFGSHVVLGSSLAKAFGAPVAVLSGSREFVDRFERQSETRLHSSPPATAVIAAAWRALRVNRECGDLLRQRLAAAVARLRERLTQAGLTALAAMPFPVQAFASPRRPAAEIQARARRGGVIALLTAGCANTGPALTLVVTARHGPEEIDLAGRVIADAAA